MRRPAATGRAAGTAGHDEGGRVRKTTRSAGTPQALLVHRRGGGRARPRPGRALRLRQVGRTHTRTCARRSPSRPPAEPEEGRDRRAARRARAPADRDRSSGSWWTRAGRRIGRDRRGAGAWRPLGDPSGAGRGPRRRAAHRCPEVQARRGPGEGHRASGGAEGGRGPVRDRRRDRPGGRRGVRRLASRAGWPRRGSTSSGACDQYGDRLRRLRSGRHRAGASEARRELGALGRARRARSRDGGGRRHRPRGRLAASHGERAAGVPGRGPRARVQPRHRRDRMHRPRRRVAHPGGRPGQADRSDPVGAGRRRLPRAGRERPR